MSSGQKKSDFWVLKPRKAEFQCCGMSSTFATYIFKNTTITSIILVKL